MPVARAHLAAGEAALVGRGLGAGPVLVRRVGELEEEVLAAVLHEGAEERLHRGVEAEVLPREERVRAALLEPLAVGAVAEAVDLAVGRRVERVRQRVVDDALRADGRADELALEVRDEGVRLGVVRCRP